MKFKKILIFFSKLLLKLGLGILVFFLLITVLSLVLSWNSWKSLASSSLQAKAKMEESIELFYQKDWPALEQKLIESEELLSKNEESLEDLRENWILVKLNLAREQLDEIDLLNSTGLVLNRNLNIIIKILKDLNLELGDGMSFKDLSPELKHAWLNSLISLEPELNAFKANIDLSLIKLRENKRFSILWPLAPKIDKLKLALDDLAGLLNQSIPILKLLPAFSGFPDKSHYLIILQNNDELRPSGGFIGSFVRLDIENFGESLDFQARDVYHLDMPAIGKLAYTPPEPIARYLKLENWYLRDANWSPDWPQSARQIQEIFQAESRAIGSPEPELDGILAITPDLVSNLLQITGPIILDGENYGPENIQALLQYKVEVDYKEDNISSWDRKNIINDLIKSLEEKLLKLPMTKYPELIDSISYSLQRGDLLLYFNDASRQNLARNLGASGEIQKTEADYLMIVDANLASFKSDAIMDKNYSYFLEEKEDKLLANLNLQYNHNGDLDWRTTRYHSYTRIYLPLGTQDIKIEGLKSNEQDLKVYDDLELDKTVLAFYFTTEARASRSLKISYELPKRIVQQVQAGKYKLYWQRQVGSRVNSANLDLNFRANILNTPDIWGEIKGNRAQLSPELHKASQNLSLDLARTK